VTPGSCAKLIVCSSLGRVADRNPLEFPGTVVFDHVEPVVEVVIKYNVSDLGGRIVKLSAKGSS
jgi:hypothetical protein